jgi:phage/plasmid primase-like uncharacterized protein
LVRHFYHDNEILPPYSPAAGIEEGRAAGIAAAANRVNAFEIPIARNAGLPYNGFIITADADFF